MAEVTDPHGIGIYRTTTHHWVKTGQLDRDLLAGPRECSSRPPVVHKLDPYKGIIAARLKAFGAPVSANLHMAHRDGEEKLAVGRL